MLSSFLILNSKGDRHHVKGAETFNEDPGDEVVTVYYRGTPQRRVEGVRQRACSVDVYGYNTPAKGVGTIAVEVSDRGFRTLLVYPRCVYNTVKESSKTVSDTTTPEKTTVYFYPTDIKFRRLNTGVFEVHERLVGVENYNKLRDSLYRQNGSFLDFYKLLMGEEIESRLFRVIYDQGGLWEVSGPADAITHDAGQWTVDGIRHTESVGEFTMYDDYEEDTLWRL